MVPGWGGAGRSRTTRGRPSGHRGRPGRASAIVGLEVPGEVAGAHGGGDGSSQGPEGGVAGDLARRLPDGAVRPPGPAAGPGVVGLGGLVLGAVLATRPVDDGPRPPRGGAGAGLRQGGGGVASPVGTVRIARGKVATSPRRKAAPLVPVAASRDATRVSFGTRSVA